jgi:hypothetical protein
MNCTNACPKGLNPARAIANTKRMMSERGRRPVREDGMDYESYFNQCLAASHLRSTDQLSDCAAQHRAVADYADTLAHDTDIDVLVKGLVEVCGTLTPRRAA